MTATAYAVRHWRPPRTPEAIAQAHPCPVPDCPVLCSPGHIACRLHWRAIPQTERDPLIAAFRRRSADPIAYALACDTARALVLAYAQLDEMSPRNAR